ncbi:MAG: DUF6527 family protein [Candidatus Micrarchaeaceae archaeon]
MKVYSIRPEYVDSFPKVLEEGVIYISRRFSTACHSCCCGCGTKTVTPIRPTEYSLSEKGGLVTIQPSIGNWNYPCQSHYLIRDNQILWAGGMTRAQIEKGRALDDAEKARYLGQSGESWWSKLWAWIKSLFR